MLTTLLAAALLAAGPVSEPAKPKTPGRLESRMKKPAGDPTHAYVYTPSRNPCFVSVTMIRSDGPLNNQNGVVWVRVANWSQLNSTQLRAVEQYEANAWKRR